jgi:hypothetical protein
MTKKLSYRTRPLLLAMEIKRAANDRPSTAKEFSVDEKKTPDRRPECGAVPNKTTT